MATRTTTPTRTPTGTSTPPVPTPTPSRGVVNGGFEVADADGLPIGWETQGGLLSQVEEPVHAGSFAGAFFSDTESTKWVHQAVAVQPGTWDELSAFVYQDDPWVEAAWLRISWYTSIDGGGSAVDSVDSIETLDTAQPGYRRLTTGPVKVPPGVHSARLRIVLRPRSEIGAIIVVDDVTFDASAAPSTPTAIPTPSVTPTRTPAPSQTPSPAATASPTDVFTPTYTPLPVPSATPTRAATPMPPSTATGVATVTSTPSPVSDPSIGPDGMHGLLANGGFELTGEEGPAGWRKHGGVLSQVESPVHAGRYAAAFYSASESTKWVYQVVEVTATGWYELDGYVYDDDPRVAGAFLRISWYESADGSGSAVATVDSAATLDEPSPGYRYLTTGPVQAPPGVRSAAARILLQPGSQASAIIYIDEASFRTAGPPPLEPEPLNAEDGSSGEPGGRAGSRRSSSASAVLGVVRPFEYTPQPSPVIRRNPLAVPLEEPLEAPITPRWPWAVVGVGAAATLAGAGWTWLKQRNHAA